jgi:hypothetical protein
MVTASPAASSTRVIPPAAALAMMTFPAATLVTLAMPLFPAVPVKPEILIHMPTTIPADTKPLPLSFRELSAEAALMVVCAAMFTVTTAAPRTLSRSFRKVL